MRSKIADIHNECRKTLGDMAGEVVPYLKINKAQAERLLKENNLQEIASIPSVPKPVESKISENAAAVSMYLAMNGGC